MNSQKIVTVEIVNTESEIEYGEAEAIEGYRVSVKVNGDYVDGWSETTLSISSAREIAEGLLENYLADDWFAGEMDPSDEFINGGIIVLAD